MVIILNIYGDVIVTAAAVSIIYEMILAAGSKTLTHVVRETSASRNNGGPIEGPT